ncbi:penicillin acylase family protein [Halobaculum sp. CBA1158]|uniref:penicillin acylase family protein n=1 Tax=Halobaculum sp. CBA1158 TaxID=2904243 RepID=UPI001F1D1DB7|nr:penicillin acylase family protein [Halobaculum sp. CBA1158]UIP00650.1 penicillin acylase family protein [Halobaculum sp. CBA1158]
MTERSISSTRRALLAAIVGGTTAGGALGPVRGYLSSFAPLSGGAWDAAADDRPATVDSPYGDATLRYDDQAVPRIEADDEAAMTFAVGYAHGGDRLFQMDLQRRQLRGELSAVVGEATLDSDRFHVAMDFAAAADATWERVRDTEAGPLVEAYCEGVNRAREDTPRPLEFELLGYDADPWTPADVMLAEKQIAWTLTGGFRTLRRETLRAELGADAAETLVPQRLDHDAAILGREGATDDWAVPDGDGEGSRSTADEPTGSRAAVASDPALDRWLSGVEPPAWAGSNSWAVAGDHTESGAPIVANDPHLSLMAPPVWYEQVLRHPEYQVHGVTFPGVPFVVIGENDRGAWGFTNAGADVIDFYEYETRADGAEYRYGDDWRAFDTETRTIAVADAPDREVAVRKSVHGAVLGANAGGDEFRDELGVAWTGLSATNVTNAILRLNRSRGADDVDEALREFGEPTQCFVYADRDGEVRYRVTGRVPLRRTDGDLVPGDRVFDGSAREGEWAGYTPYGESSWEGFIPYDEMPHDDDPEYVGTANQRIVDDDEYPYYLAEAYSDPFRGIRLWERLDALVDDGDVTPADMRDLQRDTRDGRLDRFRPVLEEARRELSGDTRAELDDVLEWDAEATRDAREPLVFVRFLDAYEARFVADALSGLDGRRDAAAYAPTQWVLATLGDEWFDPDRATAAAEAFATAVAEIDDEGWETYGDYNRTAIDHPFDQAFLNYPRYPIDGSAATLFNFRVTSSAGSSWRQVCPQGDAPSRCILPGGNDGNAYASSYDDQLRRWANGEYKPMDLAMRGEFATRFHGGDPE